MNNGQPKILSLRENLYKFNKFFQFLLCQGPFNLGYKISYVIFFGFFLAEASQEEEQTPQLLGELSVNQSIYLEFFKMDSRNVWVIEIIKNFNDFFALKKIILRFKISFFNHDTLYSLTLLVPHRRRSTKTKRGGKKLSRRECVALDLRVVSDLDSVVTAFLLNFPCFSYLALIVFVRAGISEDSSKTGLIIHLLDPITDAIKSYTLDFMKMRNHGRILYLVSRLQK